MIRNLFSCFLILCPSILLARQGTVRLDDLLKQAMDRNPKIKSSGFEAEAMSFRIPQEESARPDGRLHPEKHGFP